LIAADAVIRKAASAAFFACIRGASPPNRAATALTACLLRRADGERYQSFQAALGHSEQKQ